jgi:hypothetical protein
MFKGVFFSLDPGGTNAVIPVVKKLIEEGNAQTFNFATSFAIPLWRQSGLEFTPLPSSISDEEIDQLLKRIDPDFLFTGTSEETSIEGNFWRSARQQNIFSYSIIDHWTRYKERYIVDGIFSPTDLIFTIDEDSKREMLSLGFEKEKIVVSGQPHFEKFYGYKSVFSRLQFCDDNRLSKKKIITFVSDNISGSFPAPFLGKPVLGFDEHSILGALFDELERIPDLRNEFQLIVKLHPKEPDNNFSKLLGETNMSYSIIKGGNNMDLIFHSDFVIGMFSMLLFEAYLMNKPVLSLQLNALKPTSFGQNKVPVVMQHKELSQSLRKFLMEGVQSKSLPHVVPSATKIIETIKNNLFK